MLVVTIGGSPSQRSRSGVLLDRAKHWLNQNGVEVVSYQVRDFPAEDLLHARFDSPKIIDLLEQIERADGLVIATPVYKASFSGALKTILDLLPEHGRAAALCELNVIEQVVNVAHSTVLQDAWARGQEVALHGWVYDLQDGLLQDLHITVRSMDDVQTMYREAVSGVRLMPRHGPKA